jgi:hypothetical protein
MSLNINDHILDELEIFILSRARYGIIASTTFQFKDISHVLA